MPLTLKSIEPWAPHPIAAPLTERHGDQLATAANGTRTCVGGWQLTYTGVQPGTTYYITWPSTYRNLTIPRDSLRCKAYWGTMDPTSAQVRSSHVKSWDYLLPEFTENAIRFTGQFTAPSDIQQLTLRCTFRWTTTGEATWQLPVISEVSAAEARQVKIAVVTGRAHGRQKKFETIQDNIQYYLPLCETVCKTEHPDLIVLPEIALQWNLPGHMLDLAVPLPGPETRPFSDLAHTYHTRILLGLIERDGDAAFNTAALIGPNGEIEGRYHKVHLAVGGESESGLCAGDAFPVFQTDIGRIGCNICMDSSAAESARMVGLNGADFLLLPIMGDHRADRWSPGTPVFHEERWKAIMRTRAIDEQICLVVARNQVQGSCIVNRKGDFLAWNEGDQDYIVATVALKDHFQTWNAGCFRSVNWMQRRPHVYRAFVDQNNVGSLGNTR
jgi:predicted amidohydrolase